MIDLDTYHRVERAARGDHHRLTGRDTAVRNVRLGATSGIFYDLGRASGEAA
jgi:hypothetical protein